MEYVLGIDQGATKTLAVLADLQGNLFSCAKASGANHAVNGLEYAMNQIQIAADSSREKAGVISKTVTAVGAGITGADFPSEYTVLHDALKRCFEAPVIVVNDCMIALRAESTQANSMIICGGTGLNIGILPEKGKELILGYYIDDSWQGGGAIGKSILRAITESELGLRSATSLTERALDFFEVRTVDALLETLYTKNEKQNLKHLIPAAMECASQGDEAAICVLKSFAEACSEYAIAGLRRCGMMDKDVTVYLSGGLFKNSNSVLRKELSVSLTQKKPHVKIIDAVFEPVIGSVLIALEQVYRRQLPAHVIENVYAGARRIGMVR